jgi:hypothetical protein
MTAPRRSATKSRGAVAALRASRPKSRGATAALRGAEGAAPAVEHGLDASGPESAGGGVAPARRGAFHSRL